MRTHEFLAVTAVPLLSVSLACLTLVSDAPQLSLAVFTLSLALGVIVLGWLRDRWR